MRLPHCARLMAVATVAAGTAACASVTPNRAPDGPIEAPVLLENTPYSDNVTVILPPGERRSRARTLARMGCQPDRAVLTAADGDRFVFDCVEIFVNTLP